MLPSALALPSQALHRPPPAAPWTAFLCPGGLHRKELARACCASCLGLVQDSPTPCTRAWLYTNSDVGHADSTLPSTFPWLEAELFHSGEDPPCLSVKGGPTNAEWAAGEGQPWTR